MNFQKSTINEIFNVLSKELFPINRSLTGNGNIKTLNKIKKYIPNLKIIKFKTGKKIFDWVIPEEWNIRDAYFQHIKTKKKYANFKENNLHIVSYSEPKNIFVKKNDLLKKIYTIKSKPKLIPYVTSYYEKDWGFCMTYKELKKLPAGNYKVLIDSNFKKGNLVLGENTIVGKKKKLFLFSTNICHPSMANNELSGILVCTALANYIKNNYKKPNYTYKFVFVPETLGSLSYLSKYKNFLKKNLLGGFVLSCVGDNKKFSHIESPNGNNFSDKILRAGFINKLNTQRYSFLKRGSDERQYCSPKINLPMCGFSRSKYHEYNEYHTSGDDLNFISPKGLESTFDFFKDIIDLIEISLYPKISTYGEPFLSKYGLYRTLAIESIEKPTKNILNFLAYSDGKNSIFDIAIKCNLSLKTITKIVKILKQKKIILS